MSESTDILEMIEMRVVEAMESEDETERELVQDFTDAAMRYTEVRYKWNFMDVAKKVEEDKGRSMLHNRVIDALRIFARYERSLGKEFPVVESLERKEIGDIANQIVCFLAIRQR